MIVIIKFFMFILMSDGILNDKYNNNDNVKGNNYYIDDDNKDNDIN